MPISEISRPASDADAKIADPAASTIRLLAIDGRKGFVHGMHSPSLCCALGDPSPDFAGLAGLFTAIKAQAATWQGFEHIDPALTEKATEQSAFVNPLAKFLMSSAIWLQSLCGIPVTSHGISLITKGRLFLFVPVQEAVAPLVRELLIYLVQVANLVLQDGLDTTRIVDLLPVCSRLQREMKKLPPNTAYLLCAARKGNMPVISGIANFFVYGQGRRSVVLNSSLSARESFFGTAVAKDKITSTHLLREVGLPVAEQAKVTTYEEAISQATRIGYPVVIKPSDLDGGNGVFPGLQNVTALERAWTLARAKSANIVIEKHVDGFDYRLLVAKGELIAAIERKPAQVVGDGASSIIQLLAAENGRRKSKDGGPSLLMPLPNDPETQTVLASQGLTLEDVPPPDQAVKLRLACNHAQGGTVSWCLDRVHQANVRLALHIAEIFNLQVAGIDFITTDVSRPWWDVPSAICEVNAQPSMGRPTHHGLFDKLLARLLPNGATIPHIAVVGEADAVTPTMQALEATLIKRGFTVGAVRPDGTYLDGNLICQHGNVLQGHRAMVMHPRVTVTLVGVTSTKDLQFGLASPMLDYVVPAGSEVDAIARHLAKAFGGRIVGLQSLLSR